MTCNGGQKRLKAYIAYEPGELRGLQPPPRLGQNHHFRAKAKFFEQKPAAKNEKMYLLNEKTEFISG